MNVANPTLKLEDVWTQYQQAVKSFLHSKVSNPDDVDDLQQEILIKTYQNLNTVKDTESVKSWLFQLANRTIIDFYRKRARQQRDGELEANDLWFEEQEKSIDQDMMKCIKPFIQALPADQSELLDAVELQGASQKQLAEKAGVSYSTLKSRVQKGRTELRKLFEGCCSLSLDKHGNVIDCEEKSESCGRC
ncbi:MULTISPECIES: RNA polymerase sigma factor SigZ [Vibrio]|uniref:RNA polymerase sigma factor SigZ n=1 Tax=Vibrio TaxID=662 RepID=UPI0001B9543B|nr:MULTISPECIES: RNA polymerase sigma factor SigZ [Vibrio]EEX32805.1 RNA polymerase sigma factor SigZ [Vibrio coralliilyticus ATCC BAA-450]MCM5507689.1 RNA polymerase sigma factor SigZ [Vibrio sp. SCSIO 43169]MDE3899425.1 RNA polymerase sigma factor SigZ [Vibrio sp. CC007]QFT38896.1 ECF RNA polymerase sigma factor SigH [Vibrio sp. THAF64]QGM36567.1 ECF RNA polymerase sigma factor SigH [Vibrio sp. THAF191d]